MKSLVFILFYIGCTGANATIDMSIIDNYLAPLEPQAIELSEFDKFRLPGAVLSFEFGDQESLSFQYEAEKKPWPSWWYPSVGRELFSEISVSDEKQEGSYQFKSPLFVYDYIFSEGVSVAGDHLSKQFEPNASWSGACTLWALTSVYDSQPVKTLCLTRTAENELDYSVVTDTSFDSAEIEHCEITGGVVVYPGHLKALSALSYRHLNHYKGFFNNFIFGQLNEGSGYTDVRDIFPHEFIQVLKFQLGDNKFPVIIDTDLSEAIWNHPIYYAELDVIKKDESTLSVYITVDYATPLNEGLGVLQRLTDMVGQVELSQSTVRKIYKAELYGSFSGQIFTNKSDGFRFERSSWVDESVNDHPDIVMAPPKLSPEQMKALQKKVLKELLEKSSDSATQAIRSEVDFLNIKRLISL